MLIKMMPTSIKFMNKVKVFQTQYWVIVNFFFTPGGLLSKYKRGRKRSTHYEHQIKKEGGKSFYFCYTIGI